MNQLFNVETFKSTALRNGLAPSSKYMVSLPVPKGLRQQKYNSATERFRLNSVGNEVRMWCAGVTLPGIAYATSQTRPSGYGPWQKLPHTAMFQEVTATFYVDGAGDVINYFSTWMKLIGNFDNRTGGVQVGAPVTGILTNQHPYELAYPGEYVVDMGVDVYNNNGAAPETGAAPIISNTYREAWPIAMGEVKLAWEAKNTHMLLPVVFSYTDWYTKTLYTNSNNLR